jgi:hypothetical protein
VPQTVLSVVLEVQPESAGTLASLIEKLKLDEENLCLGITETYDRLKAGVPSLHFMSMSVFPGADYDPIFVIEVNFDGPPGPFWAQFEATLEPYLRPMLRCCKRPGDSDGSLYDAITDDKSRYPLAPYLERRTLTPSVFHQGNRGLARERILQEGELFKATRSELADRGGVNPYRGIAAEQIHQKLRKALLSRFQWLNLPAPARIPLRERAADVGRLLGFLLIVLFALAVPGLLLLVFLRAFFPDWAKWFLDLDLVPFLLLLIVPLIAGLLLYATRAPRRGEAAPTNSGGLTPASLSMQSGLTSLTNPITFVVVVTLVLCILVIAMAVVGTTAMSFLEAFRPAFAKTSQVFNQALNNGLLHAWSEALRTFPHAFFQAILSFFPAFIEAFKQYWRPILYLAIVAIYTVLVLSIPAIFLWLRWLERRDSHHDAPPIDQRELRKMTHREDWIPQNHMGSVVLVKPGILRAALFRTGHVGLGLVIRVIVTDGYLGSMRTIHFAHWAFVNNGSRLLFFSNFDHSWDSYLDDFIEKAHGGLTLAWGSGVGFPPTRFLVLDGASHGRQFKNWARHSMAVSRFWFSAYKDYTVDQIERHARIADGLRKTSLQPEEAIAWALDL